MARAATLALEVSLMYEGPGYYRHYKGNYYEVLGLGLVEENLSPVVIYKPMSEDQQLALSRLYDDGVLYWTRPLDDFNAQFEDGGRGYDRFTYVKPDEVRRGSRRRRG